MDEDGGGPARDAAVEGEQPAVRLDRRAAARAISTVTEPLPTIAAGQAASAPSVVWFSSWPALQAGTPRASIGEAPVDADRGPGDRRDLPAAPGRRSGWRGGRRSAPAVDFGSAFGLIEALKVVLTAADFDVDGLRGGERGAPRKMATGLPRPLPSLSSPCASPYTLAGLDHLSR